MLIPKYYIFHEAILLNAHAYNPQRNPCYIYSMPIKTKRWNDPKEESDGWRILVCRYRPRALLKKKETWDTWYSALGPSRELHADAYGKHGAPISYEEYKPRYLNEMTADKPQQLIHELKEYVKSGKTITLLCSSACTDENRCHRSLLKNLILL